ncbi:MAG: hypothetical protein ACLFTT_13310 [Candidatus Hydrogenedentota bacterium]
MGIGPKIAIGTAVGLLVLVIGVPTLAGLANQNGGGAQEEEGPPPPHWNNSNLVGTTWEVTSPQGVVTATFRAGGVVEAHHPLVERMLNQPYLEGTWNVTGDQLTLSADIPPPIDKSFSVTATIEGEDIIAVNPDSGERVPIKRIS